METSRKHFKYLIK